MSINSWIILPAKMEPKSPPIECNFSDLFLTTSVTQGMVCDFIVVSFSPSSSSSLYLGLSISLSLELNEISCHVVKILK